VRNKVLAALVAAGLAAGLVSAYIYGGTKAPPPPVFPPAPNPYVRGVYAVGIVESYQEHGENTNVYPEVAGTVLEIEVAEGQRVLRGQPLFRLEDSVQRATSEQLRAQAASAEALLAELRAQPRRETLEVSRAQVEAARASLRSAESQREKQLRSYELDPRSVSRDAVDNAVNAARLAEANLIVAERQFQLTKAGAWSFDITNQERQYEALSKAADSALALLAKYVVRAAKDGVVLSIQGAIGAYVSPQGTYSTYSQAFDPMMVMGTAEEFLGVRCYIDEILVPRLPDRSRIQATLFVRGSTISVPLEFLRVQPYVSPKVQLSNGRTERVDVRVLPVIFRFSPPTAISIYPGQLVDVYLGEERHPGRPPPAPLAPGTTSVARGRR
jgi:HlyD family secretion protein